jgi:hypothetical protein
LDNKNHVWSGGNNPQRITQGGRTVFVRRCSFCGRDFAKGIADLDWRAVYIGVFKVELLADAVNNRWLEEECPKHRLPDDDVARTTRKPIRKTRSI